MTATPEGGETYAEVAHEAIFRRWEQAARMDRRRARVSGLEKRARSRSPRLARRPPTLRKNDALLMGVALAQAQSWLGKRREDLPVVDRSFIGESTKRESKVRARARQAQAFIYVLLVGIILGLIGLINRTYIEEQVNWYWTVRPYMVGQVQPYVLSPDAERALKPGQVFRECAKDCPEMVVVPAGEFMMGSPLTEHRVAIAKPFAVSKFDVTFADWDACVSIGACQREGRAGDLGWGRDTRPVINVSWDDAQHYVTWLSRMTGEPYRLLTEAEWEYAARAGTQTAYPWGNYIGKNNANCNGCGSQWDGRQTAPVGSFAANGFGLYDMVGNVWKWVEDCHHNGGDCSRRVVRGGSWDYDPEYLRSDYIMGISPYFPSGSVGFRVGRTLVVP